MADTENKEQKPVVKDTSEVLERIAQSEKVLSEVSTRIGTLESTLQKIADQKKEEPAAPKEEDTLLSRLNKVEEIINHTLHSASEN